MNAQNTNTALFIGQPVIFGDMANPDKTGWIADIEEQEGRVFTLGAGGMTQQNFRVTVAWENRTLSKVSEGIARPWIAKAELLSIGAKGAEEVAELLKEAQTAVEEQREKAARERAEREREISDWRERVSDLLCMTDPVHASPKGSMNDYLERNPGRTSAGRRAP